MRSLLLVTGLRYADLRAELDAGLLAFMLLPPVALDAGVLCRVTAALCPAHSDVLVCRLHVGQRRSGIDVDLLDHRELVLGSLLHADWPLLAPAGWTATVYVLLQSLVWQVGRSWGLLILLMALFLAFVMPLGVEYLLPHLLPLNDRSGGQGSDSCGNLLVCA